MSCEKDGIEEIFHRLTNVGENFEEAIKELRRICYIEDDYAALEHLLYRLKDLSILLELSKLPNHFVRILSTVRLGELMEDEEFLQKMRELRSKRVELTALLRGRVRKGKKLQIADLIEFYETESEIGELVPDTVESFHASTLMNFGEREILLKAAQFSGNTSVSEELLLDSWERFPDLRFLILDAADRNNLDIRKLIEDIELTDSELTLQALIKATKRGLALKNTSSQTIEGIRKGLGQLKKITVPENVLVQFSFLGDPFSSGKGSSGGMGTFLRSLGNELVSTLDGVVTVIPTDPKDVCSRPLYRFEKERHLFLYVPIYNYERRKSSSFLGSQSELISTVYDMLEITGIKPFGFHMRFSDYASLAMLKLGRRLGVKNFFTLTPDPQRRFVDETGKMISLDENEVLSETARCEIAWRMISMCDTLMGIGSEDAKRQLLAYYPPLTGDYPVKRIELVPEGITLRNECPVETGKMVYEELYNKKREFHLLPDRKHLPLILTVGRLDPSKGQYRLLRAWGETELSRRFNLLIIGGNFENPDSVEFRELNRIRKYLYDNEELHGSFCHIPALDNDSLRCLEASIVDESSSPWPPVYVAPSFKEEFGIAILEAMAAGFVAFGPKRGGVKGYVKHARNGFLIDTTDELSIKRDLSSILLDRNLTPRKMRMISMEGSRQVYRRFSISIVAKMFTKIYIS